MAAAMLAPSFPKPTMEYFINSDRHFAFCSRPIFRMFSEDGMLSLRSKIPSKFGF
jgi:hypothetical protein